MKQFVYLIAVKNGSVSVQHGTETVLPGGACGAQEPHETFLIRHCLEQNGFDVSVEDFVCEENSGERREFYYSGALLEQVAEQVQLSELPLTQLQCLSVPTQRLAVEKCLAMMRADAHSAEDEDL